MDGVTRLLADDIELALERVWHHHIGATADEELTNHGLTGFDGGRHGHVAVDGHITPAQHHLAFSNDFALKRLFTGQPRGDFLGQKHHGNAVLARLGQRHALFSHVFTIQSIGNLDEDAGTIAHELVGANRTTVVQVLENLQALGDD